MRIVDASYEILHCDNTERIEIAGRTCYKSEEKIGCTIPKEEFDPDYCVDNPEGNKSDCHRCPFHSSYKFAKMMVKKKHFAMLEHGSITIKFVTNRGVTHEMVRHRLSSFGQESTRYVNYGGQEMAFIRPVWCRELSTEVTFEDDPGLWYWWQHMQGCERAYNNLLSVGWAPEQAREVLPNSLKTEIVWTANFREWRHILDLRAVGTTGRPHPEMVRVMEPLLGDLCQLVPAVFMDIKSALDEKKERKAKGLEA